MKTSAENVSVTRHSRAWCMVFRHPAVAHVRVRWYRSRLVAVAAVIWELRASWRCVGSLGMHALRVCIIPEARCRDHGSHFYGMTNCGQKWTIRTQRRKILKKLLTKHQRAHLLFSRRRCNAEWSRGGSHTSRNELFFVGGSTYKHTVRVLHTHSVSCHTQSQSTKRSHTRYTTTTTADTNHTNHSHVQYALSSVPRVARERCRPRVGPCAAQAMRTFTRIDACAAMCVRPSRITASLV